MNFSESELMKTIELEEGGRSHLPAPYLALL